MFPLIAGEFVLEFYRFVVAKILIVKIELFYIKSVFMVIIGFSIKKTGRYVSLTLCHSVFNVFSHIFSIQYTCSALPSVSV